MTSDAVASPTSASHIARDSDDTACGRRHNHRPVRGLRIGARLAPNPKHATCATCQKWLATQPALTRASITTARWYETAPIA